VAQPMDEQPMNAPAADSLQAEQAMQQEDDMNELIANGFEPVFPDEYEYDMDSVKTIEDVQKFFKELGVPTLTLMPGVGLEEAGKDPSVWNKVERPVVNEAANGSDTA